MEVMPDIKLDWIDAYNKIKDLDEIKKLNSEGKVFASAFSNIDPTTYIVSIWNINFLNFKTDELTTYEVNENESKFLSISKRIHADKKAYEINIENVKINVSKALKIAIEEKNKIFKVTEMNKIFLTLHNDELIGREAYTITYTAPGFQYLKIVIDANSGKVISVDRKSFLK